MQVSPEAFPSPWPNPISGTFPGKTANGRGIPTLSPNTPPSTPTPNSSQAFSIHFLSLTSIGDSQNLQETQGRKSEESPGWILKGQFEAQPLGLKLCSHLPGGPRWASSAGSLLAQGFAQAALGSPSITCQPPCVLGLMPGTLQPLMVDPLAPTG